MNNQQIDRAIKSVLELISAGNAYVDTQAPWTLKKTNKIRMEEVLYIVTNIIIKSAIMLYPICLLYTSPSPRDPKTSRMPSSA